MLIIIDENIPKLIQDKLVSIGYTVISIYDKFRGINDLEIIQMSKQGDNNIILTEDKDFGEWVFAHHIKDISVVFLRYHYTELEIMNDIVAKLFYEKQTELLGKFTTVTSNKIRSRSLI